MVVGWGADDVLRTALDDQQVAILNACDEFDALATLTFVDGLGEVLVQVINEHAGIVRFQITAIMRDNLAVLERDDIAADGEVVVGHFVANRGSLEWTAAFVHLIQIVTKNGGIGHLRAWRKPFGHGHQSSTAAFAGQLVHHGFMGILQQGLPTETLDGKICHAIT